MAKKKPSAGQEGDSEQTDPSPSSSNLSLTTSSPSSTPNKSAKAKTNAPQPSLAQQQNSQVLIICRNKHWRYISAFHGPWLQLPPEILETIAHTNYNAPRPRPIDPAVFFDLVKIRRLVDDATDLAVKATSGMSSLHPQGMLTPPQHAALGLGFGFRPGNHNAKLSPERKYRMREQATQKLARAYRLDEIACSVSTMQSASALEEVASLVLHRSPEDMDAKYVHFFHEKIPSRQLAECTSLQPLDEVIHDRPTDPEPLRTRGTVRIFKEEFQAAAADFTEALRIHRLHRSGHNVLKLTEEQQPVQGTLRRQEDVVLKEEDQPSSFETQVLFQRAGVYLSIACQHINAAFPDIYHAPALEESQETRAKPPATELPAHVLEARKLVRHNAKRALRDYMTYLSHLEYSPDFPVETAEDFARKVNFAANGARVPRTANRSGSPVTAEDKCPSNPHRIFTLAELFDSSPPSDLPPYPSTELVMPRSHPEVVPVTLAPATETLTFHPVLADALHSLLLCHCLVQTSAKELLRHAYMVARLVRLADGYPIFQASRSPARADWVEILRAGNNWIQLVGAWEDLCAPAPLPLFQSTTNGAVPVPMSPVAHLIASKSRASLNYSGGPIRDTSELVRSEAGMAFAAAVEKRRKERLHHEIVLDALGDERVSDETTFRQAVRARQLRAERDLQRENFADALDAHLVTRPELVGTSGDDDSTSTSASTETLVANADPSSVALARTGSAASDGSEERSKTHVLAVATATANSSSAVRRWTATEDGKDYPISTERAMAVARWILEAPPNAGIVPGEGLRRRKKRPVVKKEVAAHA